MAKDCEISSTGHCRLWLWGEDQQFALMLLLCHGDLVLSHTVPEEPITDFLVCNI